MQAIWRNATHTLLAVTQEDGHVVIVEPGHRDWDAISARADIAEFIPEGIPETTPHQRRARLPPLTRRQVFIALHRLGLITAPEAVAAAATGVVPAALEPAFAALSEPAQTDARVTFAAFQSAYRLDPMSVMIASAAGLSEAEVDAIWTGFAEV